MRRIFSLKTLWAVVLLLACIYWWWLFLLHVGDVLAGRI